jgi:tRNA(adenine34) deaminase
MEIALAEAESSIAEGQLPFGAAVVSKAGELVGRGHNTARRDKDPAAHGEIVAIRDAWRRVGQWQKLTGGTVYSSCEPCLMCSFIISQVRFGRVVFAARGSDVPTYKPLLGKDFTGAARWINRQPDWAHVEVVRDFMRPRGVKILRAFPWEDGGAEAGRKPR